MSNDKTKEKSKEVQSAEAIGLIAAAITKAIADNLPVVIKTIGDAGRNERRADHELQHELRAESKANARDRHFDSFTESLDALLANVDKINEVSAAVAKLTGEDKEVVAQQLINKVL